MHAQPIHTHTSCSRFIGRNSRAQPAACLLADRPSILLADGGTDLHAIFGAALEREGYRVIHAFSAAECLRLAHALPVHVALVSVGWCGLLPWRRLHDLAAEAAAGGFAIVCMTTDPGLDRASHRFPSSASVVLTLPCTPEALAAEVRRAVHPPGGKPN